MRLFSNIQYVLKHWLLLAIIIAVMAAFFYFRLFQYLSFEALKAYREQILLYQAQHTIYFALTYMLIYIVSVAASIPGATMITLVGGFVFGLWWGTCIVVVSATMGAIIIFLAVQLAFREWIVKRTAQWIKKMEKGFSENAFSYLMFLRLVPLFPFWLVNIVPALLGVPLRTYTLATLLGIIPGSFVYVWVGSGLGHILDANQTPNLGIIFDPDVLLPLIALGVLSLVPVIYRYYKNARKR